MTAAPTLGQRRSIADTRHALETDALAAYQVFGGWAAGTARYWKRRAATFDAARPRPDDFMGTVPDVEQIRARDARLASIAQACRHRAEIAERHGLSAADIELFLSNTSPTAEALIA